MSGESDLLPDADLADEEAEGVREDLVELKGYFILPSRLFQNVAKAPEKDPELNIHVAEIFKSIEGSSVGCSSEKDFKGLFDDVDVTSNKLGATLEERITRLAKIITGIRDLDFGRVRDAQIDLFGDAYEYLMNMYASSAGKSGGEFFTPAGGLGAARAHRHRQQDRHQQGIRPGLRLGLVAAQVRQDPGHRKHPPGLLRPGDQPHHLQPVPHQHVLAPCAVR